MRRRVLPPAVVVAVPVSAPVRDDDRPLDEDGDLDVAEWLAAEPEEFATVEARDGLL